MNSFTYVPAIAQRAVTSIIWVPGAKPGRHRGRGQLRVDAENEDSPVRVGSGVGQADCGILTVAS